MTLSEAGDLLGVSSHAVRVLVRKGLLVQSAGGTPWQGPVQVDDRSVKKLTRQKTPAELMDIVRGRPKRPSRSGSDLGAIKARRMKVLEGMRAGKSQRELAEELGARQSTIRNDWHALYELVPGLKGEVGQVARSVRRSLEVRERVLRGERLPEIALALNVTHEQVRRDCQRLEALDPSFGPALDKVMKSRWRKKAVAELRARGASARQIAKRLKMSRRRVREIIAEQEGSDAR